MTPLKRYYNLLKLDKKDVYQIVFYAAFAGLISLSLPLGIQAIINFIQGGQASVSWVVLIIMVTLGVALVGILTLMQLRITENLQQKIFVRASFEFALRMPKIKYEELYDQYAPELANRFFDTLTIQKGTSKLLLDFSTALLQILLGIILLSLYHPVFIIFGILLLVILYAILKFSYEEGVQTSLKESKFKYKGAYWLQEIARNRATFKSTTGHDYALHRNDKIVGEYVGTREKHFGIMKRQFSQLILFKVLITAGLLSVGGYLVLNQQMNIGQFVAAEIIILLVMNSIEKTITGLETLYDVVTSVEKIGQVSDLELDDEKAAKQISGENGLTLEAEDVCFRFPEADKNALKNIKLKIEPGEKVFISGRNASGKTTLVRLLSSYLQPSSGIFYVNESNLNKADSNQYRALTGVVLQGETPFEGTLLENITLNNPEINDERIKWALEQTGLTQFVKTLPLGLDTRITPLGRQLTASVARKIILARAIIKKPGVLFLEDPTEAMDEESAKKIIDFLFAPEHKWTVIVASVNNYWKERCNRHIEMNDGTITTDIKL
ncbi:ABC transporter ATP-binding protein [Flavobacterium akiainvivens]|uniref:ABC transporter ATP-binding protein n=1 Tax=Flavobacterium akiainvivens TaxID=1202724 RepID=A0A0M8MBD7_9FLAO|nr:ATP-binding cassette domain-containing protein [Flavobacterium akiainvivens]KOS06565.1 ABC transporter ATP-binding protein [Flavobacterium akiainvivens]SFQ10382.1 ABC-type bacteriocin/lantibiotic exporter, contains an N-terminal double-glycine peptidase domain [Flavobacterium akiainvivens]